MSLHWSGGGRFTASSQDAVTSPATRWQCCNSLRAQRGKKNKKTPPKPSVHAWRVCYHKSRLISIQHFIVLRLAPEPPLGINSIQVWKIVSLQLEK